MEQNKSSAQQKEQQEPEAAAPVAAKNYFEPNAATISADGRIMLGEDIEIYPNRPVSAIASPGTQAFEAKDRRLVGDQIAILCGRATVPRITNIGSYKNLKDASILRLVDAGLVDWTPESRQRFACIFDKPPHRRLMPELDARPHRFNEEGIITALVKPVMSALQSLINIELVHGAINPMNIYLAGAEGAETAVLGECLTSAPSFRQHVAFEPIERSMAQPTGRGSGTFKDDLYAFGVCVALAARGENFIAGRTDAEIIRAKLEEGSYAFVAGGSRLPGGISEFLRGVLSDDESQRWDIEDVGRWLEGRRLSPKQPRAMLSAARPFIFRDEKLWDLRSASDAFARNVDEAAQVIEQGQFDLWIKRNFEDKDLVKRLEDVWADKSGSREKFVTSACMALDPVAPVRYKGLSVFASGFGNALADAMAKGEDVQVYGEIVAQQFFSIWINYRFEILHDASMQLATYEKCRNALAQKLPGYGLERVLYILNKECVCMSPVLRNYFVLGPGSLLHALDSLARKGERPDVVLDRHMVAFISVREPKMIDPWLGHLTSRERSNQVIGYIRTLATIQKRANAGPVPSVTAWMASLCGPVVERFSDRDLRQELARQLDRLRDAGNLQTLLDLLDDGAVVERDFTRFSLARREFAALSHEKEEIEIYLKKRRSFGRATGRQIAMLVSAALATLCILGYIVYYAMQKVF
jgi:hypothetical protein